MASSSRTTGNPDEEQAQAGGQTEGQSESAEREVTSAGEIIDLAQELIVVDCGCGEGKLHLRHMSIKDMSHYEEWMSEKEHTPRETVIHVLHRQSDDQHRDKGIDVSSLSDEELARAMLAWLEETGFPPSTKSRNLDELAEAFRDTLETERQKMRDLVVRVVRFIPDLPPIKVRLGSQAIETLRRLQDSAERMTEFSALGGELRNWGRLRKRIEAMSATASHIGAAAQVSQNLLGRDTERLNHLVERLHLITAAPNLAEQLAIPVQQYSRFARETLERMQVVESIGRTETLLSSIALADSQVSRTMEMLEEVLVPPVTEVQPSLHLSEVPRPRLEPNLFHRQQAELLDAGPVAEVASIEALYDRSRSARLAEKTREIIKTCIRCNENARMAGEDDIFPPTNQIVRVTTDLLTTVAHDRASWGEIVDGFYFLLYEGAGGDSLRFLTRDYLTDSEADVIWNLKWFRDKMLRHDLEHGSPSKQREKYRKRKDALQAYGLAGMPASPEEYEQIHHGLVDDVLDFVSLLEERTRD